MRVDHHRRQALPKQFGLARQLIEKPVKEVLDSVCTSLGISLRRDVAQILAGLRCSLVHVRRTQDWRVKQVEGDQA